MPSTQRARRLSRPSVTRQVYCQPVSDAERATSFGSVAGQYDAFRPGPPAEAVKWLFPQGAGTVVDLGAGTGALTRRLIGVASEVIAVEPDADMRSFLAGAVPGVTILEGRGEQMPLDDASVDAVVASSSWHWVDPATGFAEVARVLRPGGLLAAMWTGPAPEGAFLSQAQAALAGRESNPVLEGTLSGTLVGGAGRMVVPEGTAFGPPEHRRFTWVVPLNADQLIGLLGTMSWVIAMGPSERDDLLATARRLLREVLGVDGEVTVDVDFSSEAYRTFRDA